MIIIKHIHNNNNNNHSNTIAPNNSIQAFNKSSNKVNLDSMVVNNEDLVILNIIKIIKIHILAKILSPKTTDKMAIHFNIKIKLKTILTLLETTTIGNHSLEDQIILHLNQELSCKWVTMLCMLQEHHIEIQIKETIMTIIALGKLFNSSIKVISEINLSNSSTTSNSKIFNNISSKYNNSNSHNNTTLNSNTSNKNNLEIIILEVNSRHIKDNRILPTNHLYLIQLKH
jgi:hypothetical protein